MTLKLQSQAQFTDSAGRLTREGGAMLSGIVRDLESLIAAQSAVVNLASTQDDQAKAIASLTSATAAIGAPGIVLAIITQAADPVATDLPDGYAAVYNSASGLCLFGNVGGVIKKVVLT